MADLRYPIGKFEMDPAVTPEKRAAWIDAVEACPASMREAVAGLTPAQVETPYRPGGWTVRQVVHHVPDSHMNAYCRFKFALTEQEPTIKSYPEDRWAELADSKAPVEVSLALLESLHRRWVLLLRSLTESDWRRTLRHPELGVMTLERVLALYAWHGRHHVAHINAVRNQAGQRVGA
jgi:uncharacterized damage-inducible protein DinB